MLHGIDWKSAIEDQLGGPHLIGFALLLREWGCCLLLFRTETYFLGPLHNLATRPMSRSLCNLHIIKYPYAAPAVEGLCTGRSAPLT